MPVPTCATPSGYCTGHRPFFRGLRPHLVCTLLGRPIASAPTWAKADERHIHRLERGCERELP
ncbi:hypothetical protein AADR41_17040 [Streptomyces sp. CLV115]|uniref:hypothetical protein n=1 Tax=Streptomyces sp. CLV115 TaxID=3138502 RepID=UPI00313A8EAC